MIDRVAGFARRHEVVTAGALLVVVAALWFWPLLIGHQMGQSYNVYGFVPWRAVAPTDAPLPGRAIAPDVALEGHPWIVLARDQLQDGHLPLWNPYAYGGTTFVGNFQSALFFPLTWLLLVLPLGYAWGLVAVLKLALSGLGTHLLARTLGAGRRGAFLAGVVYMLAAPTQAWLQWPVGYEIALFPWLVLALARLTQAPGPGRVAALALTFALMILAGHPETALVAVSAGVVFLAGLLVAERREAVGRRLRTGAAALGGLGLAALAAAVAIVPFLEAYGPSVTRGLDQSLGVFVHLPPVFALGHLLPHLFGDGRPEVYGDSFFNAVAVYFAFPALLLAAVAVGRRRARPEAIALVTMGLVGGLAVYGLPPVSWIVDGLPPWSSTSIGDRGTFVLALAGAVLAGIGFGSLTRRPLRPATVLLVAGGTAVLIAVGYGVADAGGDLDAPASVKRDSLLIGLAFLLATAGLLAALGRLGPWTGLGLALILVVAAAAHLQPFNVILPPEKAYPGTTPALAALGREPGPFRIAALRSPEGPGVLPANTSVLAELESIEGYDFPLSERWARLETQVLGFPALRAEVAAALGPPTAPALRAYRMLNTRYWIAAPDSPPPAPGFEEAYRGPDATVFRDPQALPRAYVVPGVARRTDDEALAELAAGRLDARTTALVPPGAPGPPAPAPGALRPARAELVAPDHVRVRLAPGSAGWLVLANAYHPTWKAEVDGEEVDVEPTNYAAMGVPVQDGDRVVDFRLDRTGFWAGAALSLLGAAGIAGLALLGRRRRRT